MRDISEKRKLIEKEGIQHAVVRGWRKKLHFENLPFLVKVLDVILSMTGFKSAGKRNALKLKVAESQIELKNLPGSFDGMRILFISDIHAGKQLDRLPEVIAEATDGLKYDLCILGGDYNFDHGPLDEYAKKKLEGIAKRLSAKTQVFGVLGNHDRYSNGKLLAECGVEMLVNDNVRIEKNNEAIYIAGIDDNHYYRSGDVSLASEGIGENQCSIMISHSPEPYKQIADAGYDLCLCGHTHAGQVCLPTGIPVVANATVPRKLLKGRWNHENMQGYTSSGAGVSGVAVRFNCEPEVAVITLKKDTEGDTNQE